METSALDASNVEAAFESILKGTFPPLVVCHERLIHRTGIYRIVSNKKLENTEETFKPSESVSVGPSLDPNTKQGSGCC